MNRQQLKEYILEKQAGSYDSYNLNNPANGGSQYMNHYYGSTSNKPQAPSVVGKEKPVLRGDYLANSGQSTYGYITKHDNVFTKNKKEAIDKAYNSRRVNKLVNKDMYKANMSSIKDQPGKKYYIDSYVTKNRMSPKHPEADPAKRKSSFNFTTKEGGIDQINGESAVRDRTTPQQFQRELRTDYHKQTAAKRQQSVDMKNPKTTPFVGTNTSSSTKAKQSSKQVPALEAPKRPAIDELKRRNDMAKQTAQSPYKSKPSMDNQYNGRPNFQTKGEPKTVSETKRPAKSPKQLPVQAQPNFQTKGEPRTVSETKRPTKSPKQLGAPQNQVNTRNLEELAKSSKSRKQSYRLKNGKGELWDNAKVKARLSQSNGSATNNTSVSGANRSSISSNSERGLSRTNKPSAQQRSDMAKQTAQSPYKSRPSMDNQYNGRPNFQTKGGPKTVSETKRPTKSPKQLPVQAQPNFQTKGGPKTVSETKRPSKPPKQEIVRAQPNFQTKGDPYFKFKSGGSSSKSKPVTMLPAVAEKAEQAKNARKLGRAGKAGLAALGVGTVAAAGKMIHDRHKQQQNQKSASNILDEMYMEKTAGSYDTYNLNNINTNDTAKQYMDSQYGKVRPDPNFRLEGGPKTVSETKRPPKQLPALPTSVSDTKTNPNKKKLVNGDQTYRFAQPGRTNNPNKKKLVNGDKTYRFPEVGRSNETKGLKGLASKLKNVDTKSILKGAGKAGIAGVGVGLGTYGVSKLINANRNKQQQNQYQDYERTASDVLDGLYKQAIISSPSGASGLSNAVNAVSPFAKASLKDATSTATTAAIPQNPATTPSIVPSTIPNGGVGTTTPAMKTTANSPTVSTTTKQAEQVIDDFEKALEKCASETFGKELQPKDSEYMANKRLYVDLFNSPNINW